MGDFSWTSGVPIGYLDQSHVVGSKSHLFVTKSEFFDWMNQGIWEKNWHYCNWWKTLLAWMGFPQGGSIFRCWRQKQNTMQKWTNFNLSFFRGPAAKEDIFSQLENCSEIAVCVTDFRNPIAGLQLGLFEKKTVHFWTGRGISYNPGHGIGNGYGLGRAYGPRTGYEAFPDDRRRKHSLCIPFPWIFLMYFEDLKRLRVVFAWRRYNWERVILFKQWFGFHCRGAQCLSARILHERRYLSDEPPRYPGSDLFLPSRHSRIQVLQGRRWECTSTRLLYVRC